MVKKIAIVVLLIALAVAGYFILERQFRQKTEEEVVKQREPLVHEKKKLEKKVSSLEKEVAELAKEIETREQEPPVEKEKQLEVFGEELGGDFYGGEPGNVPGKVKKFFAYIDTKGYLKARGIEGTAYEWFKGVVEKLEKSAPVVSGESQDAYVLLKNISYFFRVLGKADVLAIKDILTREAAIMEPTMQLLYVWMDPANDFDDRDRITLPLEVQYEYAAFFLQTMAGKAYLFRRDSNLRHLMTYYSILVLDKANDNTLNKYGVDIKPPLDSLIKDMQSYRLLADKKSYLRALHVIKKKTEGIRLERPGMHEGGIVPEQQP